MSKKSPMQLSLDYLSKCGFTCEIVEHWNHFARVRKDCFGFGDILCYGQAPEQNNGRIGIALVQTTSWDNFNARLRKIVASPHFKAWKRAGGRIFLHGWGDKGLREEEL